MFSKFEMIGAGASIFFMALALYLVQVNNIMFGDGPIGQSAQAVKAENPGIVIVGQSANVSQARADAYREAADNKGNIKNMVIDDVKIGTGEAVKEGDTVVVHYKGELQGGGEFDNSKKRGAPFEFKVGEGRVIEGWDKGLVGMQVGGERTLVIPPDMAYGAQGIGPIPGNSTLVFAIELIAIK